MNIIRLIIFQNILNSFFTVKLFLKSLYGNDIYKSAWKWVVFEIVTESAANWVLHLKYFSKIIWFLWLKSLPKGTMSSRYYQEPISRPSYCKSEKLLLTIFCQQRKQSTQQVHQFKLSKKSIIDIITNIRHNNV